MHLDTVLLKHEVDYDCVILRGYRAALQVQLIVSIKPVSETDTTTLMVGRTIPAELLALLSNPL